MKLFRWMMEDAGPERLSEARNMREAVDLLRGYPMIDDFLAYQHVTDLNRLSLVDGSHGALVERTDQPVGALSFAAVWCVASESHASA